MGALFSGFVGLAAILLGRIFGIGLPSAAADSASTEAVDRASPERVQATEVDGIGTALPGRSPATKA